MSVRDVLILGNFRGASRSALTTATNSLRLGVVEFTGVDEAIAALESEQWKAILVDTTLSGASRFCAEARAVRTLFDVPLIALSPRLTDLAFLNALRWGADDVVALGAAEPLAVRLASLFANPASSGTKARGTAVVADPDRRRGDGLGRALHLAGYSVKYANDAVSARYYLAKADTNLYVLNSELADPVTLLGTAEHTADCRTVVLAKPTQLADLEQQFRGNRNVVVMSSGGPPENVLFAVNLLFPNEASKRGETRALFGTVVFFRAVGDYRDECGFSYTASPQGIYVRTLAPAPSDKVWVELIPPDGERRVRLVGRVAWSRPFGSPGGEAAPPGFGVRIVDGLGEDLSLWSMCLRSLEFRAPATLVPEARFSTPMSRLSSPDDLRPYIISQSEAIERDRLTPPPPPTDEAAPAVPSESPPTPNDANVMPDAIVPSAGAKPNVAAQKGPTLTVNLSNPPTSLPLSRLRNPANQVSTRPSLRLSVPGPANARRDSLLRSGKLSRPPHETEQPEPMAVPSRPGQGQTVLGLGLLKRDGSASDNQARPAVLPPPAEPTHEPTPEGTDRRSLEPYIVSPVTGRTLNYGSDTPAPPQDRPTFPPNSWDDDTTRTNLIDDISDRPTLTDRLSAPQNSVPVGATGLERETFTHLTSGDTGVFTSPDAMDSLPPDALESDAPPADLPLSKQAPLLRRDPVARTYFGEPPVTVGAETDKNWIGLDPGSEDLFSAAERELESATHRASIPTSGTLPGFASPAAPLVEARTLLQAGEIAPDTDPDAPLTTPDNHAQPLDALSEQSPFEAAPLTPLPPTRELVDASATQTITAAPPPAPSPKRAVWFVVVAALCGTLALGLLARRPNSRPTRGVDIIDVPQKVTPNEPVATAAIASGGSMSAPSEDVVASQSSQTVETIDVATSPKPETADLPQPSSSLPNPVTTASPPTLASEATAQHSEQPVASVVVPMATPTAATDVPQPPASTAVAVVPSASSPPKNPQDLPAKNAWLFVRASTETRVFVHGVDSGVTNTWIETPCGTRFIRLGRAAGDWLGPGFATVIRCRNTNIVEGVTQ